MLEGSAIKDSRPVVVNVIVSFTLIMVVVGLLLGKAVIAISALVRRGLINPELLTCVVALVFVVVTADFSGVSIVVIAVSFNALLVEISSILVYVDSVPFEVVGCEETGLVSVSLDSDEVRVSMGRSWENSGFMIYVIQFKKKGNFIRVAFNLAC